MHAIDARELPLSYAHIPQTHFQAPKPASSLSGQNVGSFIGSSTVYCGSHCEVTATHTQLLLANPATLGTNQSVLIREGWLHFRGDCIEFAIFEVNLNTGVPTFQRSRLE